MPPQEIYDSFPAAGKRAGYVLKRPALGLVKVALLARPDNAAVSLPVLLPSVRLCAAT